MQPTEQQQEVRSLARKFAQQEIAPHAAEWDRLASFPRDAVRRMGDVGLLGMTAPAEYGGADADAVSLAIAVEEIARADASCALVLSMANSLAINTLMKFGTAQQRDQWLRKIVAGDCVSCFTISEPQAGSDPAAMKTRAIWRDDRYIISGIKQFISLGSVSELAFVFAITDPALGAKGISCFLVPTASKGYAVLRKEDKMGLRASDTCQIALDDVEVDAAQMVGQPGDGYRIALFGLGASRIGIAAQATGVAAASLDDAATYARERETFGKRLVEHQAIAFKLADMAIEVQAARLMTRHAADLKDSGLPYATESSMAKVYAAEMCERVCSAAIQVFGGYGYMKDNPVERRYRDARVFQIYEGTSEVQRMIVARALARQSMQDV
jgi:alkylation response protein AidB-like acyl-CoA dehydrogenase